MFRSKYYKQNWIHKNKSRKFFDDILSRVITVIDRYLIRQKQHQLKQIIRQIYMAEKKLQTNYTPIYVGIGVGVLAVAAAYYIFGKKKTTPIPQGEFQSKKPETFEQKYTRVIHQIQAIIEKNQGEELSLEAMKAIYQGQYQLANAQSKQVILKSRRRRRRNMHNKQQYCKICQKTDAELEQILDKHLGAILARFKIDKTTWMHATSTWSSTNDETEEEWGKLLRQEDEKLLDSLRNPVYKAKPSQFIKNVLYFKIKELENLKPQQILSTLDLQENLKYTIIESYIEDRVFEKFSIEQEDIEYSLTTYNQQTKQELEPLYENISELMTNHIYDYEDGNDDEEMGDLFG